ncbi:hypothetical protein ACHAW6_015068 [Cyclotella cf. meneghiniana]
MDFGFLQESSEDYTVPKLATVRLVESFDGHMPYLLDSKKPLIGIISIFLMQFRHKEGVMI